jgi:hypothetical protein
MKGKAGAWSLAGLGVLLIAAAAIIRFVVLPGQAQFPDDVDTTRTYEGTVSLLNAAAVGSGDFANLFLTDVPVTIDRTVQTIEVDGGEALVEDAQVMKAPDGSTLLEMATLYTIDRKTMDAVPDFTDNGLPDRQGLVIGWPIGTEKEDYVGWSDDPAQTVTLAYAGEEERGGITTYKFTSSSGPEKIVDPDMLANFPPALPQSFLTQAAPLLGLPADMVAQLGAVLPALPDPVPLSYTYEFEAEYWVDPTTGVVVDTVKHDKRDVVLEADILPAPVPLTTVYDLNYTASAQAVEEAVDDAQSNGRLLAIFGTWIPLAGLVLGLLALGAGLFMMRGRSEA